MTHEIDVPADVAFLAQLTERAEAGLVTYLTHQGRRIGLVVPADVVDVIRQAFVEPEDDLVLPEAESHRRFRQLAREQGVQPVTDPAELRGPGTPKEAQSLLRAIAAGEIEPPAEHDRPDIIPELADPPSLSEALITARERERGGDGRRGVQGVPGGTDIGA